MEQPANVIGPSSNISLMRIIFRAMARIGHVPDIASLGPTGTAGMDDANIVTLSQPQTTADSTHRLGADSHTYLPPDGETEDLIRQYFSNTGMLFPYIHEQSFLDTYWEMKQNKFRTSVRRTWLGLLNMMLAMVTCASGRDKGHQAVMESEVFYTRAQELCKKQMLRGTTLEAGKFNPVGTDHALLVVTWAQFSISSSPANICKVRKGRFRHGFSTVWQLKRRSRLASTQRRRRLSSQPSNKK